MAQRAQLDLANILQQQSISQLSAYQSMGNERSVQQAAQKWLKPCLPTQDLSELIVCNGSQAGLFATLMSITRPGDKVMCEALTYPGLISAAQHLGVTLIPIDLDSDGPLPDAIERAHAHTHARVIYLNPTLHNPTTYVMPCSRREEIAALLRRLSITLIEDDPYRSLLPDAPPPIAEYASGENTYYLASLSKCLWPGLQTGFLVPPRDQTSGGLASSLRATSMGCSVLMLTLVEQWLRSGLAEQLVAEIRSESQARQRIARTILQHDYAGEGSGLHIWVPLPGSWTNALFVDALNQQDVQVAGADSFGVGTSIENAIRISLGPASSHEALARALGKVEHLLRESRRARPGAFV